MKIGMYIWSAALLIISTSIAEARTNVEGIWTNTRHRIEVRVEQTARGIKVLRSGQSRWRQYEEVRNNQFEDNEGNIYYVLNNGELEWESYDGRKQIRFIRGRNNRTYRYDRNTPDNRALGRSARVITPRDLQGTWRSQWDAECLVIRSRRGELKVRGLGWGSRTFHSTRKGFVDHKGNLLRIDRRELVLINRRGKLRGRFVRR